MSKTVTVLGAGLVGRGWAIVFARGGHDVRLFDLTEGNLADAFQAIDEKLTDLTAKGLLSEPEKIRERIHGTTDLSLALQETIWVQECAFEKIEVKRDIFTVIDQQAPADAILASSTSTFPGSAFSTNLQGRHRCLVVHPINPPYLVPLVEIVPTPWTSLETTEQARKWMSSLRQVPIVLNREVPGFVVNRLQVAVLSEAFRLVQEEVISVNDLDRAISDGLGLRWSFMGPFETIDLNAPGGIRDYIQRFGESYYEIAVQQAKACRWDEPLITKVEQERRKILPVEELQSRQRWRDIYLMSVVANKRARSGSADF